MTFAAINAGRVIFARRHAEGTLSAAAVVVVGALDPGTIASRSSARVDHRCRSRTFALQQREEGFHGGVVFTRADAPHRST
jgi:hypothetical protein